MGNDEKKYLVYSNTYRLVADGTEDGVFLPVNEAVSPSGTDVDKRKCSFVQSFFANNSFQHIALLAGSGTSALCDGPTRDTLWDACKQSINSITTVLGEMYAKWLDSKDIEGLLSYVIQYNAIKKEESVSAVISELKTIVRQRCNLKLTGRAHAHVDILRKLTARKISLPRAEIFTTNYDTLFEQAAKRAGFIMIDGFSFAQPRIFSGRFFDLDIVNRGQSRGKPEENYIPNVIHFHKLHGSLDWVRDGENVVQRDVVDAEEPLIIYPSKEKYAESYDQPYFEMMARFQTLLRKEDCLLIVAGYGFADKHINNVIIEAVRQNPSFHLLIVDYGHECDEEKQRVIEWEKYKTVFGEIGSNITIVQNSFEGFVSDMPHNRVYQTELQI